MFAYEVKFYRYKKLDKIEINNEEVKEKEEE